MLEAFVVALGILSALNALAVVVVKLMAQGPPAGPVTETLLRLKNLSSNLAFTISALALAPISWVADGPGPRRWMPPAVICKVELTL